MDFKGFIFYFTAWMVEDINQVLSNGVLALNGLYIAYQIYTHHKKNKPKSE